MAGRKPPAKPVPLRSSSSLTLLVDDEEDLPLPPGPPTPSPMHMCFTPSAALHKTKLSHVVAPPSKITRGFAVVVTPHSNSSPTTTTTQPSTSPSAFEWIEESDDALLLTPPPGTPYGLDDDSVAFFSTTPLEPQVAYLEKIIPPAEESLCLTNYPSRPFRASVISYYPPPNNNELSPESKDDDSDDDEPLPPTPPFTDSPLQISPLRSMVSQNSVKNIPTSTSSVSSSSVSSSTSPSHRPPLLMSTSSSNLLKNKLQPSASIEEDEGPLPPTPHHHPSHHARDISVVPLPNSPPPPSRPPAPRPSQVPLPSSSAPPTRAPPTRPGVSLQPRTTISPKIPTSSSTLSSVSKSLKSLLLPSPTQTSPSSSSSPSPSSSSPSSSSSSSSSSARSVVAQPVGRIPKKKSQILTLTGHTDAIRAVSILSDGAIVSGSLDHTIKIWTRAPDGSSPDVASSFKCKSIKSERAVSSLTTLADDTIAVGALRDVNVYARTGQLLYKLTSHTQDVHSLLRFSPMLLISGSKDETIKMWNLASRRCHATLKGHNNTVNSLIVMDTFRFVSAGYDKTVKIWDIETRQNVRTLEKNQGHVTSLGILPHTKTIFAGDAKGVIKVWEGRGTSWLSTWKAPSTKAPVMALAVMGTKLAAGYQDGTVVIWDARKHKVLKTHQLHDRSVNSLCVIEELHKKGWRQVILSGSQDKSLKVWRPKY